MPLIAQLDATTPFEFNAGKLLVNWQDGAQQEFNSTPEFISWLQDNKPELDTLRAILLLQCLIDDPLMDSPADVWAGRKIEVNPEAVAGSGILKVTPA